MRSMLKHEMFLVFKNNENDLVRVRVRNDFTKDVIYSGVFEKTFKEEFSKKQIAEAIAFGWIKKDVIRTPEGVRNVYLWLEQEMTSPTAYKRFFSKVFKWWERVWAPY